MNDIFDNERVIVGPYDWSCCRYLARYVEFSDEYFRQVMFFQFTLYTQHYPTHYEPRRNNCFHVVHAVQ